MIAFVPYVVLLAGVTLLYSAAMANAEGVFNGLVFRLIPAIVGAATVWSSALLFLGSAQ